ncbi:adenylate/guanylate cyclase domain-containing protein [Rhodobium gokarnense]|uniref:Class 3 adenylate cyclase/CHASE2 domain-containing sensor protein n=1 Tax=Rhodobium gokarnense TaxID=364296 RepID=A0ABT3H7P1_9HYPH|nr:adenylate/guanylate cyclase domain-containing protein [Rhodobium gokarnense]MCW2306396.1 class 3 adenylate cyclase/CHASE2 domain-containing sensor protein [Rhodobium gokarnense]
MTERPERRRRLRFGGWPAAILAVALATGVGFAVGHRLEPRIGDILTSVLHVWHDPPKDIVVVAVDEETLSTLPYRSPIDRAFLAELIARIDRAKPAVIGLDILIDQRSEPAKDLALLSAVRTARTPIVMGFATRMDGLTEKQAAFLTDALAGFDKGLVTLLRERDDGTVRDLTAGRVVDGDWQDGLAAAIATRLGAKVPRAGDPGRITYFSDAEGRPHRFPVYPAHVAANLPDAWFAGKAVLIGAMLPTADLHQTPFTTALGAEAGLIHGVLIHAQMLAQMLAGTHYETLELLGELGFTALLAVLTALVFAGLSSPLLRIVGLGALLLALWAVGIQVFTHAHLQLPLIAPSLAALVVGGILAAVQWLRDRAQRDYIEHAFSHYVSPALVRRMVSSEEALALGGEKRIITSVFTDLEGFTHLAEGLPAQEVAELLNEYLDRVCGLFLAHEATIDKIVGDAVVGFFGAPESQDDQAARAVALALAVDAFSEGYRSVLKERGISLGVTRIGVHRGEAIVGNFGGKRFFDYTAIGDTVNTASRLEAANRTIGGRICVSGTVAEAAPDRTFRPIGTLVVKGKSIGIACFEPLSGNGATAETYRKSFAALEAGDLDAARAGFEEALREAPGDPLSAFWLGRIAAGQTSTTIVLAAK